MRYLRQFCAVTMLVCAFAFSAHAGNIPCPGVASSPPTVAGDMPLGVSATDETPYGITDTLLLMILALI